MFLPIPSPEARQPLVKQSDIFHWCKSHYRDHTFARDERIPTRPGIVYLVESGAIRMVGKAQSDSTSVENEEVFLGFVGKDQPFEIISQYSFQLQAHAHLDRTSIVWLYWEDLEKWPQLYHSVLQTFRYQHQRKLLWLSILGQKRAADRMMGYLTLLMEEHGQPTEKGYYLPYPITHAQIGSAIGTTRVTVTRLMGKLRQQGLIFMEGDNLIGLPSLFPPSRTTH